MAQTKRYAAALDKVGDLLEEALTIVQELQVDKQVTFDSRSDQWQTGEKGKEAMEELSLLEQLASALESAQEAQSELTAP